jgi:undecaprenol kinase
MKTIRSFFDREQNLLIHIIATVIVIILGIIFKLSVIEWVLIFFVICLVISSELLNSAIELTVDLYTSKFNPLAMVAKDTAAAAVVVSAFIAIGVGLYVFLPKVICFIS